MAREQGSKAIAVTAASMAARIEAADGAWASCMAYPVWRYQGVAILSVPAGDPDAQLATMHDALRDAGYDSSLTRAPGKIIAGRPGFSYLVEPVLRLKPDDPHRWKAQFQSEPCSRFSARDRKQIKALNSRREPLDLGP